MWVSSWLTDKQVHRTASLLKKTAKVFDTRRVVSIISDKVYFIRRRRDVPISDIIHIHRIEILFKILQQNFYNL